MKYWIFQSNQVLGPYEPDDLSKHSAFGAESLVCPEGRRGTSMGDWQRAGMVPDLSVALVRASQSHGAQSPVATLGGLPPEPTLKDLAILGSLQEKMAMMEDVVVQLQQGLSAKDAELATLHQELAGKERQSSVMKSAMERETAELRLETEERKRAAEELQVQTNEFKRKLTELEERVGVVNRLSETIDKAVEAEKNVEHDVVAQGATIAELTKEIEALRTQLTERLSAATPPAPAPPPAPVSSPAPESPSAPSPFFALESPSKAASENEIPAIAPTPAPSDTVPVPNAAIEAPRDPAPPPDSFAPPIDSPFPAFGGATMPSFGTPAPESSLEMPIDPMAGALAQPSSGAVNPGAAPIADAVSAPAQSGRKKAMIFGGLFGLVALGAYAFVSGMGKKKPSMPASMADTAPLPTPTAAPAPVPVVDPREAAIEAAKEWALPDGRKLGQALETLSPPIGNLSPWMAEPLADDRVSVNYFAHGGGAGAPTVAYEFEVDLGAKTVAGRNPAAKAVIAGKAAPPPAPPKAKRVTLKPKPKRTPKAKPKEENLDSLLGTDSADAPKTGASLAGPAAATDDDATTPAENAPAAPAKPTAAKRAAKAAAQSAPAAANGKAADETLLDDILKE